MKKKYAFLLMGSNYNVNTHKSCYETEHLITYIITVNSIEDAYNKILTLKKEGIKAIELCGAFGKENADKIIEMTNNEIAVGYVTHIPEQDKLFNEFFSD